MKEINEFLFFLCPLSSSSLSFISHPKSLDLEVENGQLNERMTPKSIRVHYKVELEKTILVVDLILDSV